MLKFLGSGSAFNTELGNNCAYIKNDNCLFLIDCGSDVFSRLMKTNLLEGVEHVYVLVTHTHPDHVGSLGDLVFYSYYSMGKPMEAKLTVISPFDVDVESVLASVGVNRGLYDKLTPFENLSLTGFIDIGITPVATTHVDELECYGYIITYDGKTAYYSGDSNEVNESAVYWLTQNDVDVMYVDTCGLDYEGNVHLSLSKLTSAVPEEVRGRVHCMHLDKSFDSYVANFTGFKVVRNEFDL